MKKIEYIYRELLYQTLEKNNYTFTQLGLSKKFHFSLSTVNYAIKPLKEMGAVEIKLKNFQVIDLKKILYYWASIRNIKKDILYQTRVDQPVAKIEAEMPAQIIYGAYSAYKFKFKDVPADYSEVYIYGELEEIQKRFPSNQKTPNLFVLKKDEFMEEYGKTTTLAQTFVDLWNIKEWYAAEFITALNKKIGLRI